MAVRAKFIVNRVERSFYGYGDNKKEISTVVLTPVSSQDPESENKKFWEATPSGEVKLGTINQAAADYFELGEEYYLDFTKAEKAEAVSA